MKKADSSKMKRISESILDYWHTLEFLSQDALPELTYEERRKNEEAVKRAASVQAPSGDRSRKANSKTLKLLTPVDRESDLLELVRRETSRHGMTCWGNITVYVGKSKREWCIQKIARALREEDVRPESNRDEIAWFGLQLNPSGGYIEKTFSLSTIIWAMNHIEKQADQPLANCLSEQEYREDTALFENYLQNINLTSVTADHLYHLNQDIKKSYIKDAPGAGKATVEAVGLEDEGSREDEAEFTCVMMYQIFVDEETRDRHEEDDYSGLGKTFFADDLKLVLSKLKSGEFGEKSPMQRALIRYIAGAYADYYPKEKVLEPEERVDLGHPSEGDESGAALRKVFADILDVENAPLGKWPSRFMPALMQQTAVNLAVGEHGEKGPVFSVNGPPGTGKTTLLKEIIVHNIIERAALLADYGTPDDAFEECSFTYGEKRNNGYSDWFPKYYRLKNDKINDYSILVTSCNNAAVENITKELPLEENITGALSADDKDSAKCAKQLREVRRLFTAAESGGLEELYCKDTEKNGIYRDIYFTMYANGLLDLDGAWGLISAALGKKSNIHRFYQNVLRFLDEDFYKNEKIDSRLEAYREEVRQFQVQKETVERMQRELVRNCREEKRVRSLAEQGREHILKLRGEREQAESLLKETGQKLNCLEELIQQQRPRLSSVEQELRAAEQEWEEARSRFQETDSHYEEKLKSSIETREGVGLLGRLFHTRGSRVKNELADKYAAEAQVVKTELKRREGECAEKERIVEEARRGAEKLGARLYQMETEKEALSQDMCALRAGIARRENEIGQWESKIESETKEYRKILKEQLDEAEDVERFTALDEEFMKALQSRDELESTHAQVANPWFTSRYNREREKLFYRALQLTKAFLLSSRCCLRNYRNLALLWQETKVDNEKVVFHPADRKACYGPLLQSLFLLVPVISTTFASVGSFLRDIREPNVIGTLIVDEAGQAPPQMAVGALYRSRKAIIVGDPRQVEPVVTDDLQLLKNAYRDDLYKPYKSKRVSVQQFADLMNPYGTYMENEGNEREWLGCPLVVHRRCISPMYEISNFISYNNTMKQQTKAPSEKKAAAFCYSGSRWINVTGKEKGKKNHFVEAQGKRALKILEIAFSKSENPSLFVITPFTTVKSGMIKCIENSLMQDHSSILYQKRAAVREWMYRNIGTVHTFQGKEANEVIFLLGCDAGKEAMGAVRWVNSNIVNVAVTRAKYRLYIIGDERAWRESLYISQAKRLIDIYALRELSCAANGGDGESEEENRERALTFYSQLPTSESIPIDVEECEEGQTDYSISPEIYLNELKGGGLLLKELTDEQLRGYGFTVESFGALNPQVREYIEWGIKLYSMFKKLMIQYELQDMDTSCCAILFCKAIELQVRECFYEGVKKSFPDDTIRGFGGGKIPLKKAQKKEMTLGTFQSILHVEEHKQKLAERMRMTQNLRYDRAWWDKFDESLGRCKNLRNSCCHSERFLWKQMNDLLTALFLRDRTAQEPVMDGLVRDSEIGRRL